MKKSKEEGSAIVAAGKKELAVSPDINALMADDAGVGQESMDRSDYAIPRIKILQDLSPQVKKTEQGYIKGSEAGMICDPISEQVFDGEKGVLVIPISYRRSHIEWRPREKGGGIVADHGADGKILEQTHKDDRGRAVLPNGNQITINAEYFVFLVDEENGSYTPYVLGMAGTQLKKSRRWNTMINQMRIQNPNGEGTINPAMFYRSYKLSTEPERNDQGSWFGWHITPDKPTTELENGVQLYLAAREFRKQVVAGAVQAQQPAEETHASPKGVDDELFPM
jgi:hypothetical protein